ncbi:MAG: SDR family oxidoreductase [Acidobacteriota bacterium]
MPQTLAITGSTGQLGRLVVQKLTEAETDHRLVGLARSTTKAADLGISVREASYDDPVSLVRALSGVDTILLISGSEIGRRVAQHRQVIEAARQNDVRRVVYTSLLHADTSPLDLAPEHAETEAILRQSGLAYTILRNGWYTENYTGSIGSALEHGAFIGSAGDGRIASAARADYADAAVTVLLGEGHAGKTYELAGDTAYTLDDLAAELSRQAGRTIPYRDLPEADYAAALLAAGLPEPFAHALASWDVDASNGALFDDGHTLSTLIGRPTTALSTTIAEALARSGHGQAS